jgi:hypothetical protein
MQEQQVCWSPNTAVTAVAASAADGWRAGEGGRADVSAAMSVSSAWCWLVLSSTTGGASAAPADGCLQYLHDGSAQITW